MIALTRLHDTQTLTLSGALVVMEWLNKHCAVSTPVRCMLRCNMRRTHG